MLYNNLEVSINGPKKYIKYKGSNNNLQKNSKNENYNWSKIFINNANYLLILGDKETKLLSTY